jgi:polar amino acid transport system substrate-binding protein
MTVVNKLAAAALGVGLAAAVVGFTGPASADDSLDKIKAAGTVKIGMLVDFPPYGIMNTKNEPDGYDADVAKLLAKAMGVKLDIVPVTGPNRIPYVLSGQVDLLVASLGITPERAERVDFSSPYAGISISVFGQTGVAVKQAEDLAGKTIAVARASTQDVAVTKVAPKEARIQRFDDDASAVQALLSGQVPLMGLSNVVIAEVQKRAPGKFEEKFRLSQQVQGIVVRPKSDQLLAWINGFLKDVKANGELDKIHQKWLGQPLPDFLKN